MFIKQAASHIPQPLRKVNIIVVRVLKAQNLIPKRRDFSAAVVANLVKRWLFVNTDTALENRFKKRVCCYVS